MNSITLKNKKTSPFFGIPLWSNFMDDFLSEVDSSGSIQMRNPRVNISETNNAFQMLFEVPGFRKNDFTIKMEEDTLVISGTHQENENKNTDENVFRREFRLSSFTRKFQLPEMVNAEAISAAYEDGLLKITLPKLEAKKKIEKEIVIS
ncbi:MAG TPA: Hsp20/alpha crystallin family protein [Bacteroidia bacterium]|nr:Hsp20/alpha crystallin family protein [Bacteroidia bacterium]HNT80131.1 Hsp20/alpha crystallin family protein [Bacteroidia bacterium]